MCFTAGPAPPSPLHPWPTRPAAPAPLPPRRTLYKAYGLLFVVDVQGRAGKFSLIPLCLNLGAGLALLSIATVICDIIVLHCMRDRRVYRDKKYLLVTGSDAFQVRRRGGYEGLAAGDEEDCSSDTGEAAGDSHVRGPPE